ncbi:unnamed protein product [Ixodes pacificus]
MDVDQVFHLVGEIGPQQILYFLYTSVVGGLFVSGQMLQIVFTGATPEYKCWNGTEEMKTLCDSNDMCRLPQYTSTFTSIATEVSETLSSCLCVTVKIPRFGALSTLIGNRYSQVVLS